MNWLVGLIDAKDIDVAQPIWSCDRMDGTQF